MDAWWNDIAEAYLALKTGPAIREAGLSIVGVKTLCKVLNDVIAGRKASTIDEGVANWCARRPELTVTKNGYCWYVERRNEDE